MASQILAGKGFDQVINMSGGIRAWDGPVAVGSEELGIDLFTGNEPIEETLAIAYALEAGLRDFYLNMMDNVTTEAVKSLFQKLSDIEALHQDRILEEYNHITGEDVDRERFESGRMEKAVEGGLTTDEYLGLYKPDFNGLLEKATQNPDVDVWVSTLSVTQKDASRMGIMKINEDHHIIDFYEKPSHPEILEKMKLPPSTAKSLGLPIQESNNQFLASMGIYLFKRKALFELLQEDPRDAILVFAQRDLSHAEIAGNAVRTPAIQFYPQLVQERMIRRP